MRVDDLTVEVRDRTLKRVGQVTPVNLDLKARTRWSGVGEWTLTLPGTHAMVPHLATAGSGIILLGPDGTTDNVILSGPTRTPTRVRNRQNPDGTFTFNGVTDEVVLQGALAFPDPSIADPQASSQSRSNDTRSGVTEDLLREFVAYNVANGAVRPAGAVSWAPGGRLRGLRSRLVLRGESAGRGLVQQKSPRFQNLLELLQEMIAYDPALGFRVVQVGGLLEFQVIDSRDRSKFVRFDVENGTVTSEEVQSAGPAVTDAIVAGQGEGTARTIVQRRDAEAIASEDAWGVPFETFIDQRDTDDLAELQQSGDEALLEGRGGTAVKMVPSDDTTMEVGTDWRAGDVVGTVVGGVESVARVTEVAYIANSSAVMAGAALGDVSGFTAADAESSKVQSLDQRLSNLERASAGPVALERLPRYATRMQGTTAERDALFGVPSSDAARVALANRRVTWFNTDLGWEESYYATTGLSGLSVLGLVAGVPSGWFPTGAGDAPRAVQRPSGGHSVAPGTYVNFSGTTERRGGSAWFDFDPLYILVKNPGRYEYLAWTLQQSGSGTAAWEMRVLPNPTDGSFLQGSTGHSAMSLQASPILAKAEYRSDAVQNQDHRLYLYTTSGTLAVNQVSATSGRRGELAVRYLGPPLVTE